MVWIKLNEEDSEVAKEFMDVKSLQQSHLKVTADGSVVLVEIPPPPPPVTHLTPPPANLGSSNMTDLDNSEDLKEIKAALKVLTNKVTDMAEEMTFLRESITGSCTPASTRTGVHSIDASVLHDPANVAAGDVPKDIIQMWMILRSSKFLHELMMMPRRMKM